MKICSVYKRGFCSGQGKDRNGSPNLSIDRTFRSVFDLPCAKRRQPLTKVAKRRHRNPIRLAQEWQEALTGGKFASSADLARHLGISRARVTQILRLLKLCPEVLNVITSLGDPLPSPIITERSLRPLVDAPPEEQSGWITTIRNYVSASKVDVLCYNSQ